MGERWKEEGGRWRLSILGSTGYRLVVVSEKWMGYRGKESGVWSREEKKVCQKQSFWEKDCEMGKLLLTLQQK